MKQTFRFLALMIVSLTATGLWAQTWTASAVGEGTFYLYNVGNDGFMRGANDWDTRASLTKQGGIPVTLAAGSGENVYSISTSPTYKDLFLGHDGYVDVGTGGNYTEWKFIAVEGETNTYRLQATANNKYIFGHASDLTKTTVSSTLPNNTKEYWKLVTRENLLANFVNASEETPIDATFLIMSPYFGRVTDVGSLWKGSSFWAHGGYNIDPLKQEQNSAVEMWNKTYDSYQEFTGLPNGVYRMTVQGFYRVGDGVNDATNAGAARAAGNEVLNAKYYLNEVEGTLMSIFDSELMKSNNSEYNTSAAVNINGTNYYVPSNLSRAARAFMLGEYVNPPIKAVVTDGNLRLGIKKTVANSNDWAAWDNITLTYYGIDLSALVENYENLVTTATSLLTEPMEAAVKTALNTALTTAEANVNKSSQESLEENSSLLGTAISNAQTSNALYTGSILPAVNAMKAQSASESVKSAVQAKYDNGEYATAADVYAYYQPLEIAALSQDAGTDYTSIVINPDFELGTGGWQGTPPPAIGGTGANLSAEIWNATFDVYQTITGLPNGYYEMTIQGFYRVGDGTNDASKAAAARAAGNEVLNAAYYLNDASGRLMSIFNSDYTHTSNTIYNTSAGLDINGTTYYVPNNMSRAAACFAEGEYTNAPIRALVTDGTLRIGISKSVGNSQDWAIWDNVTLTYEGSYTPSSYTDVALTLNIENDEVAAYLANTTYTESNSSVITSYNTVASARNDQPASISIPLPAQTAASTLYVSLSSDYASPLTYSIPASSDLYRLANLLPGQTYYYKVVGDGDAVVTNGTITTTGQLRMIKSDGISNMRDLGGWTNADGNHIRYGKIFRGSELRAGKFYNASDADLVMLKNQLNIGAEVDLREDIDFASGTMSTSAIDGATYYYANLNRWSEDALNLDAAKFKSAFDLILAALKDDKAAYFHCIYGADRTGCFAFLLEGLLGLPVDQLYKDYELTSFSSAGLREKTGIDHKLQYIKALQGDNLQQKFYNYWRGAVGVSESDLNDFIDIMIDGTSPITTASLAALPTPIVADGEYYIYLPTVEKFLGRGEAYGARALGENYGVPVQITTNGANVSTIKFLDSNLYFGSDCFTDKVPSYNTASWFIEQRGEDLILKSHNGSYMGVTTESNGLIKPRANVASAADAASFTLKNVTEQKALVAATQEANILAAATAAGINAADVAAFEAALSADYSAVASTAVIKSATAGSTTDWPLTQPSQITDTKDNYGNAYNVGDYGAELYQRHGYVSQTVTVPHAGLYKLTLNALYRQGSKENSYALGQKGYELSNAYVSVNDEYFAQIPSWYSDCTDTNNPDYTNQAKALMDDGKYAMEIYAYIGNSKTATITVNVPGFVPWGWCLFNNFALTEYAKKVTIDEAATTVPEACDFADVTATRTITANKWATLCLPFNMAVPDGWEVREMTSVTEDAGIYTLHFTEADEIQAGKPYMVKTTENVTTINAVSPVVNEPATTTIEGVSMIGTFSSGYIPAAAYFVSNNTFYQAADNTNSIKAFRAYFNVSGGVNVKGLFIDYDSVQTAIPGIINSKSGNGKYYDLSGRVLNRLKHGITIVRMPDGTVQKILSK